MKNKFLYIAIISIIFITSIYFAQPAIGLSLDGVWKFKADPKDVGNNEKWYLKDTNDSEWENINVPGTYNEGQNVSVEWNYEGPAWYRRKIQVPQDWRGENIKLKFLAVYLIADVWLNGKYLGNHKGGYTAFSFDVSETLNFDNPTENVLVVRCDNTKRRFQIPGHSIDWWNCGGITREVFLEKHPPISLKKMFITPQLTGQEFSKDAKDVIVPVKVKVWFDNKDVSIKKIDIKAEAGYLNKDGEWLSESENQIIAEIGKAGGDYALILNINNPKFWDTNNPNLYKLRLSWRFHGNNASWWTSEDKFGVRKIEVRGTELYLNGEKIWLQGIAIHQDYAGMGSAVTHEAMRSDLERIKKLNSNFVRLGHYPFHSHYLEVCDEIGLLAWAEIPVWQHSPEELSNEKMYQEWVKPQLDEMINQQYNHPSVIFWSVANEISRAWEDPKENVDFIKRTTDYVRELDSTRLVSYASAAATGANTWQFIDVISKPLHYGWFHSPNVYDIGPETDKIHAHLPDRPIFGIELCGMSYPDNHAGYSEDVRFSVEYHDKLLRVDMQHLMIRKEFVCGVTLWTLADLKGGREKGTYGILDRERNQVKHLYETIKNLYSKDPKLLIIDQKTKYQPGEKFNVELWSFSTLKDSVEECKVNWWITGSNGRLLEGEFNADIAKDSAKKLADVSWDIPEGQSGFHSLLCTLEDKDGNVIFVNDYYFDVGAPEKPAILWVKVIDETGDLVNGANVTIDGFVRVTDEFGRVPFLLNTGNYKVKVETKEQKRYLEAQLASGDILEIVCNISKDKAQ